jgi:hypothetical protein
MELAKQDTDRSQEPTPRSAQQEEPAACKPEEKVEDGLLAGRALIKRHLAAASFRGATLPAGNAAKAAESPLILQVPSKRHPTRFMSHRCCF